MRNIRDLIRVYVYDFIYNYTRQYYLIIIMSFLFLFFLNFINIVLICFSGRHVFMCYMAGCAFRVISLTYLYHLLHSTVPLMFYVPLYFYSMLPNSISLIYDSLHVFILILKLQKTRKFGSNKVNTLDRSKAYHKYIVCVK